MMQRFVVEGPKIEKMLGYTNIDSEKDFYSSRGSLRNRVFSRNLKSVESKMAIL